MKKIALLGNPNSGKSTLFNLLTGLNQKVGNFPGVTVDKKEGSLQLGSNLEKVRLIDFPGCYSLYPNSSDEKVVVEVLTDVNSKVYPDLAIYVADCSNLERHMLLATQILDLGIPMVLALNMSDQAKANGIHIDESFISDRLGIPVCSISARANENIEVLKQLVTEELDKNSLSQRKQFYKIPTSQMKMLHEMEEVNGDSLIYRNKLIAHHHPWLKHLSESYKSKVEGIVSKEGFVNIKEQIDETMERYNSFIPIVLKTVVKDKEARSSLSEKIDRFVTHRVFGPILFFALMFLVFQAIYSWATVPMDWIESAFASLSSGVQNVMPDAWYTSLLVDGLIAGVGGVVIFVPQIAVLFFLLTILEEVGYMSRAVFMFDGIMRKVGLNGRSIVALVSSGACAIPAIMSARTIGNKKERMITILVSPLISCSARIPVYVILVGFVIAPGKVYGLDKQGLVFMGLYLLGIVAVMLMGWIFKLILKSEEPSQLMIELPTYKPPRTSAIFVVVKDKVKAFIVEAGKVIMLISVILWFLASYGPGDAMKQATTNAQVSAQEQGLSQADAENLEASYKLESSYAGHLGKFIEPVISPLGFDWKIGIALISSFAAREVFVGTMATIYSVGSSDDEATLRERMRAEVSPDTGKPVFGFATSLSLLIFYVFAMQCMSTLAVTYKETLSWKWPMIQLLYMTALAYFGSLAIFQIFS